MIIILGFGGGLMAIVTLFFVPIYAIILARRAHKERHTPPACRTTNPEEGKKSP
jgi:hypothetical protein